MRACFVVIPALLLAASSFATTGHVRVADQNEPGARPIPAATGNIRGRVTSAAAGKPLRRVRVTLFPAGPGARQPQMGASTNSQGQFEVTNVPAGQYRVSASRAGFITIQYGQRRPGEEGLTVDVRDGQVVEHVDIALPQGAVFAGRITDELGEPYPGVRVDALALRYLGGRRVPSLVSAATTDDLGQFRIIGLQPGTFYVSAASRETWVGPTKDTYGFAYTYFPGGTTRADAQPITITLGQQRTDLDFRLVASRTARVMGWVQSTTGEPVPGESVSLQQHVGAGAVAAAVSGSARTDREGRFEIRDVSPGDYLLSTSRRPSGGQGESVSLPVAVSGVDVKDIILVPRSSSTVTGAVVGDESTPLPFSPARLRVFLVPGGDGNVMPTARLQAVGADGAFRLQGLGGPFLFRLDGLPEGWMIARVRLGDEDISEVPFDVPTGGKEITGLQMTITQRVGTVSGKVVDSNGRAMADATVILYADDAKLWVPASRFVRTTRPDNNGHFAIKGLPPGRYRAIGRAFIEEGQSEDIQFLESLRPDSTTFELLEGGSQTLALKLLPPRR